MFKLLKLKGALAIKKPVSFNTNVARQTEKEKACKWNNSSQLIKIFKLQKTSLVIASKALLRLEREIELNYCSAVIQVKKALNCIAVGAIRCTMNNKGIAWILKT